MVSLEEFTDGLARTANGVGFPAAVVSTRVNKLCGRFLPCRVNARWLGLVEAGDVVALVKADNQRTNAKRAHTTTLCITLLNAGDIFCDVFDRDGVLDSQTMRLGLQPGFVDQDSSVGVQTGKGKADVAVDQANL